MSIPSFSHRLLHWFDSHGRHDLPWQQHRSDTPDAYQVWLSEVMLQQTQVSTVIPYFVRFMQSFPTVQQLAAADWDTVATYWAGLGYYARARNLHTGAKQLVEIIEQTGDFPQTVAGWEAIAGVGRSTAGAIVAMGLHGYGVICDGNVKRVLTRWAGIDGDISKAATSRQLWALAEQLTPHQYSGKFAQAMMDMGATVCTRQKPACLSVDLIDNTPCPLMADCVAYRQDKQTAYPVKAKKTAKPSKHSQALLLFNPHGELLWSQRPDSGIWGGLWCLPLQFIKKTQGNNRSKPLDDDAIFEREFSTGEQIIQQFLKHHGLFMASDFIDSDDTSTADKPDIEHRPSIKHTLTHFHWYLTPVPVSLNREQAHQLTQRLIDAGVACRWLTSDEAKQQLALPKAMLKIISQTD